MQNKNILVTGANGEIGQALIPALCNQGANIIALDIKELDEKLKPLVKEFHKKSILDKDILRQLEMMKSIDIVIHLAAILSTAAERDPYLAHQVNVEGSYNLLAMANSKAEREKKEIIFFFPSSIAVYRLPTLTKKNKTGKVKEHQHLNPITIYGVNKLYVEYLGSYLSTNYQLLSNNINRFLDFRCLRFPGLLSSETLPTGGTSDYAPEMINAAKNKRLCECFVRPDTKIPFMAMPDAVSAILQLIKVPRNKLRQHVYNVGAFSISAREIEEKLKEKYPKLNVNYKIDEARQKIVDSWPVDVNDNKAKRDWSWKSNYNISKTLDNYFSSP